MEFTEFIGHLVRIALGPNHPGSTIHSGKGHTVGVVVDVKHRPGGDVVVVDTGRKTNCTVLAVGARTPLHDSVFGPEVESVEIVEE